MRIKNFKHELHEHKLAQHFDLSGDLFFCLARVCQDFRNIYPVGDALHYYDVSFHISQNQKICSVIFRLKTQVNDIFQPEITLHYEITQQKTVNESQLEQLYQEAFSQQHIEQIDDLNQLNVAAKLFKYIDQAKSLFAQWNESYYSLAFHQFRLTMFDQASLEYGSTLIVLIQPTPVLLEPHYNQDNEELPLTAYVLFSLSKPPFIFQHFIKDKTEDIIRRLSLQPKNRVKRQNEKLRQHNRSEDEK